MTADERKKTLTTIAYNMAEEIGAINITRAELCKRAGVPDGSWHYIMGESFDDFIDKVMETATVVKPGAKVDRKTAKGYARREQLLAVGLQLAEEIGYDKVNRDQIGERAKISGTIVNHYFKNLDHLKAAIMLRAVAVENLPIIAQGIVNKHEAALSAPRSLRRKALESLL